MSGPVNPDTITFDAPVAFVDGSPIPANGIAKYEYGFSQSAAGPFTARIVSDTDLTPNPQGKQTHELDLAGFAFGQWYAAARAVSADNMPSAWSNVAAFEVRAREPKPPTGFSVG
jgi:hypothetical protein